MLIVVVAAVGLGLLALIWLQQRRMIYFPFDRVPAVSQVLPGAEEILFETEDGLQLAGWFMAARTGPPRATVLCMNGNGGNRAMRAPLASALAHAGFSVLLFDYRGYGGNPGRPSEKGLIADARAARAYLASRHDTDPQRIVYFGESLGAAVAVALATEIPPAQLILRSPFTSLTAVGRHHYPFLPVKLMLRDRYSSLERIVHVASPLLVIAGARDRIVPATMSRTLFETALQKQKRFVMIEGAGHNDAELLVGERMIQEIVAFIE